MFYSLRKFSILYILLIAAFLNSCNSGNNSPTKRPEGKVFPGFQFSKVIAYDYDGSNRGDLIIEKGKIHHSVKQQVELSDEQTKLLLDILNDTLSYGDDVTRCFKPHLGVIFFDETDKAKAQVSICFLCNQHNSFPLISAQEKVRNSNPKQFHGYSKAGKTKLMEFCQSLGFSNCGLDTEAEPNE